MVLRRITLQFEKELTMARKETREGTENRETRILTMSPGVYVIKSEPIAARLFKATRDERGGSQQGHSSAHGSVADPAPRKND